MRNVIPVLLIICGAIAVFLGVFQIEGLNIVNGAHRSGLLWGGVLMIGWAACMFDEVKNG